MAFENLVVALIARRRGRNLELRKALRAMPAEALEELFHVLQEYEQDLHRAEHTWRPFPGGPRIRV
jgi:hypothetical protein